MGDDGRFRMPLVPYLHRVASGADLSSAEARAAMTVLLEGSVNEAQVGGFLTALRMKGETASELAGFARALRERMVGVDAGADVIDMVGTGGDGGGGGCDRHWWEGGGWGGDVQQFDGGGDGAGRGGWACGQARQPGYLGKGRQRGRA